MVSHYDGFAPGIAGKPDSMLIPAFSLLIKQGTACPAEGDIKITMTMSILNTISGTVQLSEMYSIDFVEDICIIGHSGGAASPTTDHLCLQMVDRQIVSPRFLSCSSFAKEKMDGAGAPQVLQHRLSLSAESGIPPSKRARPTNRKKATPGRGWLTLFSEIAHKFRYTVLRQNCHMVLQRLANLPLLYHWRFFFPMVYVELFRFTRSIAGGFLFMNSLPGFPVGNPGKNIICFPCRRGCPRPWGRGTSWR